jgi:hypothetical protein
MKKGFGFVGQLGLDMFDVLRCRLVMRRQDRGRARDIGLGFIVSQTALIVERGLLTRQGFGS